MSNPIPPDIREKMQAIATAIRSALPDTHGFALLVFDYGRHGDMSYISSARRDDMRKALRELLANMDADELG